jgi:hypothetical protein
MQQSLFFQSPALRAALFLGLAMGAGFAAPGCGDDAETTTSTTATTSVSSTGTGVIPCGEGGIVIDDVCVPKCVREECEAAFPNNTCVNNACALKCDSQTDCPYDGTLDCVAAVEDDTMAPIQVCAQNFKVPGYGRKCPFGDECDPPNPPLKPILACPDGTDCSPEVQCGGQPASCEKDEAACRGKAANCNIGKCPDMSPCVVQSCPANECAPLSCLTSGEGDAEAYCTRNHCKADADCPGGYFCGITRDPHLICGSDPEKPVNGEEPCIDPADYALNGATFQEGPISLLRNTCLKRSQCATCASDIDCSQIPGQRCVAVSGPEDTRCGRLCNTDDDCDLDYQCTTGACVPRFGACSGQGNFCEPCQSDLDCGDATSTVSCRSATGDQKACFDGSFPDTCMVDGDCPQSPSGDNGECLDAGEGLGPGDQLYQRCYFPYIPTTNKFTCW